MGYRTPSCTLQTPLRILLKHCSLFVQAHDTLIIRHPEPLCSSTVFLTSSLRIIISFSKLPLLSHRIHFRGSAPLSLSTSLVSPKAYISRETWLICSFIYIDFFFFFGFRTQIDWRLLSTLEDPSCHQFYFKTMSQFLQFFVNTLYCLPPNMTLSLLFIFFFHFKGKRGQRD